MEIRQLRYFKVIAEARSFARGANHLRVAQPALSRSIAKLEEELGQPLFLRQSTGVWLTEAGTKLYDQANEILDKIRDISDSISDLSAPSGIVRFGGPQTLHTQLLVPIAKAFLTQQTRCELDLVQESGFRLREMVSSGLLDMAIAPTAVDGSLHSTPLIEESICLICLEKDRQQFGKTVTLAQIADLPLIVTGYPGTLRLWIDRQAPQLRTPLRNVRSEVNSASLLAELVLGEIGYGLATASAVARYRRDGVSFVPIDELTVSWSLVANFSRMRMAAVHKCHELVVDYVAKMNLSEDWPTAIRTS